MAHDGFARGWIESVLEVSREPHANQGAALIRLALDCLQDGHLLRVMIAGDEGFGNPASRLTVTFANPNRRRGSRKMQRRLVEIKAAREAPR
jgi:hypothetical protein